MRILHYSLGFPPYRSGGMIKYCMDLMYEQIKMDNYVAMLWPGMIISYNESSFIVKKKRVNIAQDFSCDSFELVNPLPVSLLNGINDVKSYTQVKNIEAYERFFKKHKFDILHVHSLMGLPVEVLEAAKKNSCKIVFTTHDYFGLCPKTSFVIGNHPCDCMNTHSMCEECNRNALSLKEIQLVQSPLYRVLKNSSLVKKIRRTQLKNQREDFTRIEEVSTVQTRLVNVESVDKYEKLRNYYFRCFSKIDFMHFNSTITFEMYKKTLVPMNSAKVLNISHRGIRCNLKERKVSGPVRIAYLGAYSVRKGCGLLIEALDYLYSHGIDNFRLVVFSKFPDSRNYIVEKKPYTHEDLSNVFDLMDMLVLPSIWYETFGFTVLEALSYGIPALVSSHAGASDIVKDGVTGLIFVPEKEQLVSTISQVLKSPSLLEEFNHNIISEKSITTMGQHAIDMIYEYNNVLNRQNDVY